MVHAVVDDELGDGNDEAVGRAGDNTQASGRNLVTYNDDDAGVIVLMILLMLLATVLIMLLMLIWKLFAGDSIDHVADAAGDTIHLSGEVRQTGPGGLG